LCYYYECGQTHHHDDHHDNDHDDDANDYAYICQFQLPQRVSTNVGGIHNNKVWYTVRKLVNIHTEQQVLLQPLLPLLLLLHLQLQDRYLHMPGSQ